MKYQLIIKKEARKNLASLSSKDQKRVDEAILKLADNLSGDIKKLKAFSPRYRLRVGNYRVLFDVEGSELFIEAIVDRKEVYKKR
jgi:mRNA interferase RelE/StbE